MFSVLGKLGWFFKAYWKRYAIAVLALSIVNLLEVLPPMILGDSIDKIFTGEMTAHIFSLYIGVMLAIAAALYGLTYIWQYNLFGGAFIVEKMLRSRLMNHFLKMAPPFFERNRTGDLMARTTNDLRAVSQTAGFGILTLVDSTMYMLTIILTMAVLISWKLTLVSILPLPFLAAGIKVLGEKIHRRFTVAQDAFGDLNNRVLESVAGVRVIRAYNQEIADETRFQSMTEDVYQKNIAVEKIDALFNPLTKIITGMSYTIGLAYGTYLVFHQQITLGNLVSFNVYLGMLTWPMFAIGELMNVMQRGNASLDRVNETLRHVEDVKDPEAPKTVEQPDIIEFADYTFRYPKSREENLKHIYLKIKKGETIGITGKTGSGKTTLIKQLLREYPLGSGRLLVSGVPIEQLTKEEVLSWIGYVPQDHVLFSRTVKENILFGTDSAGEAELQKAIRTASLEKDIEMLPDGLETLVGEKGVALSGGQKQRISIARAVIKDPEILILDDALSAVDAKTEAAIISNIRKERKNKTTIIATHRLSAIEHAQWIVVLDNGRITEEGAHEQLLKNKGWYYEQYMRQQLMSREEVEA
ncbi:ABC transporter ATP-binding protein [Heyndrickxia coagulans]|uniref:ABC transporter ATP-binding protein n=1 Tax=Heyndrickxia coagulans TaxID=1398 RepID=UPI0008F8BAAA|nr:ABC transporter ATP-binding protein [Heyndrickxia coagulans]APB36090.1 multidrug ABC transporter permease/ATP-binding protein [Heyndrickxia coagulans]QPG54884.1 ABC transporter ATP-binding protein [Heyndrickxia coagulans]WNE62945.1 ABC transporter ATP-binding protein [Heyndrickxia coagulans]